jgi:hypothetical protein
MLPIPSVSACVSGLKTESYFHEHVSRKLVHRPCHINVPCHLVSLTVCAKVPHLQPPSRA